MSPASSAVSKTRAEPSADLGAGTRGERAEASGTRGDPHRRRSSRLQRSESPGTHSDRRHRGEDFRSRPREARRSQPRELPLHPPPSRASAVPGNAHLPNQSPRLRLAAWSRPMFATRRAATRLLPTTSSERVHETSSSRPSCSAPSSPLSYCPSSATFATGCPPSHV